jgi:protein disulfide-isomerase A6
MAWKLKDEVEVVLVGRVDVTVETVLTERFDVVSYPTLILIANGEVFRLPGHVDRTLDNLMTFANGEYNTTGRPLPPPRADSKVVELKEKNFNRHVRGSEKPWFVKFYAPWCGHCKELVPVWDELADELDGQVNLGKVDVTAHTELAEDFNVTGYPTLKLFADGQVHSYPYQRTVQAMTRYALGEYSRLTANTSLPIPQARPEKAAVDLDAEDFWKLVGRGEPTPWFLKFHVPQCGFCKSLKPEWESMAGKLKGRVNVGNVNCELEHELAQAWNVDRFPSMKFITNGKIYDYFGAREAEDMIEFALTGFEELQPSARLADPKSQNRMRYDTALAFISGCVVASLLVATYMYCTRESDNASAKPIETVGSAPKKSTTKLD